MQKLLMMLPLFLLAAGSATAQDDGITRFFNQYVDDERFTVVFVSPKMFQMVAKIETDDEDWNKFRDVVKDLGGLRVLTSDSITNGLAMYKDALSKVPMGARNIKQRLDYLAMYKDALSKVPSGEYSELLTVRDGQENVRIWIKDSGNVINELLLLVGSPDEFTLLSFTGKIDLDKISTLSKTLDIKGADQLEKIKQKD